MGSAGNIGNLVGPERINYSSIEEFSADWTGKMLETPARIEPCFFEDDIPRKLVDLATEIHTASRDLERNLHPGSAAELAEFVRVMNCYYSNLIEGHDTRPKDIERALAGLDVDEDRRPLALEAKAHVEVHREIDVLFASGALSSPTSTPFLSWAHRRFYEAMPEEYRFARGKGGRMVTVVPGTFRSRADEDVMVGRHQPPSSDRVDDFMTYFGMRFGQAEKWAGLRVIALACAHHRFNYIHPFVDGNGRVSRLMSHAMALRSGIGGGGLWSVSRGLARGLADRGEYRRMMDHADTPRRGARDGRGNLSEAALVAFCEWFLSVALDQIRFMNAAFRFDGVEQRYRRLLDDLGHETRAGDLLAAIMRYGEIERGRAHVILDTSERTARSVMSRMVAQGFLKSETPKSAVRVAFPIDYRERLFPNLFADAWIDAPEPPRLSFVP